jgi:hypothetical protein
MLKYMHNISMLWLLFDYKSYTLRQRYICNFPIVNFPFICSNIPATHAYRVYIPELVVSIWIFFVEGCCLQGRYWAYGFYWLCLSHHFESFTVDTMTWLTASEYLCHKWPRIGSTRRNTSRLFPHSWLIT